MMSVYVYNVYLFYHIMVNKDSYKKYYFKVLKYQILHKYLAFYLNTRPNF